MLCHVHDIASNLILPFDHFVIKIRRIAALIFVSNHAE